MSILHDVYKYEDYVAGDCHSGSLHGSLLSIINPKSRVIVSAPHSVKQLRDGKIKSADINTFGIAMMLHQITGCSVISITGYSANDANYDSNSGYKDLLSTIVKDYGIRFVVDIHGSKDRDDYFDIDLGTDYGKSLLGNSELSKILTSCNYLSIVENKVFSASNRNTITNYVYSVLGVSAVQMELSRTLRCSDRIELYIKYMVELISKVEMLHC